MAYCSSPSATLNPAAYFPINNSTPHFFPRRIYLTRIIERKNISRNYRLPQISLIRRRPKFSTAAFVSETESEYETEEEEEYDSNEEYGEGEDGKTTNLLANGQAAPPVLRRRRRYRKLCPGEAKGITEEMRFVAMKLRKNDKSKEKEEPRAGSGGGGERSDKELEKDGGTEDISQENDGDQTWQPSVEGFLKYLVDSEMVFRTVERIVDESSDVSYVYFRKTGLERSDSISRDIEWFMQNGHAIPEPSNPGRTYAQYLQELAENSPPLFLCHFYNIYFSHMAGGQVIAKKVSNSILEGRELEFYRWDGDAEDLLRGVREKLNALGEHWSRDEKNKCLRESTKAFRFLGQIVRLIIL